MGKEASLRDCSGKGTTAAQTEEGPFKKTVDLNASQMSLWLSKFRKKWLDIFQLGTPHQGLSHHQTYIVR